jgi:hypothetical protein
MGSLQRPRQALQLGLGQQRISQVVGHTHLLGDGRGERVGQPVSHVAELDKP